MSCSRARLVLEVGPIELVGLLASMDCQPTAHYHPELAAKHSTLFRELWRVLCSTANASEVRAKTYFRITSSMHKHRLQQTTSLFKVILNNPLLKLALED